MIANPINDIASKFQALASKSSLSSSLLCSDNPDQNASVLLTEASMSQDGNHLKPFSFDIPSIPPAPQGDEWLHRFHDPTPDHQKVDPIIAFAEQELPVAAVLLEEVEPLFLDRKRTRDDAEDAIHTGCLKVDPPSPSRTITISGPKRIRASSSQDPLLDSAFANVLLEGASPSACSVEDENMAEDSSLEVIPAEKDLEDEQQEQHQVIPASPRASRVPQADKWKGRLDELTAFQKEHGHTNVPHNFKPNSALARWIKRQRHQYRLLKDGQPSTMTAARIQALEELGFVWDVYSDVWEQKMADLKAYQKENGNVNVPCNYPPNPQLAIWVKCQRRQYRLFQQGRHSSITTERIHDLEALGFLWGLRSNHHS